MPSTLPPGDPVPIDGALPTAALASLEQTPLGIYLHVPFCRTRCGYCDFNTYTASELGADAGASQDGYVEAALAELDLARSVLGDSAPPVSTIFVGGGTPTLLPAEQLGRFVAAVRDRFGMTDDVEITTESNPESIDLDGLRRLVDAGFTRISFGMQSAVPYVLTVLDRVHTPGRPAQAVAEAKQAGFAHTSLDVIFGTPGESLPDWQTTVQAVIDAAPDHVSAYALIIEEGTRLNARIRRGELPMPDDDDLADKYELTEDLLTGVGYRNYEISNWATTTEARCRHNLNYWRGANWWGIGPGAHSHVGGVRWWNVKHPRAYAGRIGSGHSPGHAREILTADDQRIEQVMLELRLAEGLDRRILKVAEQDRLPALTARGLVRVEQQKLILTRRGRLLADGVVRDLLD